MVGAPLVPGTGTRTHTCSRTAPGWAQRLCEQHLVEPGPWRWDAVEECDASDEQPPHDERSRPEQIPPEHPVSARHSTSGAEA